MQISKFIYPKFSSNFFEIVKKLKTPCVCYDYNFLITTIENFKRDLSLFSGSDLYFAIKANNNIEILKILKRLNLGVDVASYEEYNLVRKLNFNKISITSPCLSADEIEEISKKNIIDIDNVEQINYIHNENIGIRISLDNSKYKYYGISVKNNHAFEYVKKKNKKIIRIHYHANNFTIDEFLHRIELSKYLIKKYPTIREINMGGDLLTLYKDRKKFLKTLIQLNNDEFFKGVKLIFEPGDALLKYCGFLLTTVVNKKIVNDQHILFTDSSMWVSAPWGIENPIILNSRVPKKNIQSWEILCIMAIVLGSLRLK
ncbi:hypothetical protein [Gemella cuniculi]|uniref:hypothetical protein n=1 Tax=Gemella cuniculi TaxID=150240 RepID=UPI0004116FBA|nr:hypothetical protein [Gemella cuniculi]